MAHAWAYAVMLSVVRVVHFGWTQTGPAIIHYLISNHINHVPNDTIKNLNFCLLHKTNTVLSLVKCSLFMGKTNYTKSIVQNWIRLSYIDRIESFTLSPQVIFVAFNSFITGVERVSKVNCAMGEALKLVDVGMIRIRMRMNRMNAIETIQMEN